VSETFLAAGALYLEFETQLSCLGWERWNPRLSLFDENVRCIFSGHGLERSEAKFGKIDSRK
jgi:hypothetical protein